MIDPIATSDGEQAKQFMENKQVVQELLESVDKKTLPEIKEYIQTIEINIRKKKNAYAQFSDMQHMINSVKDGNSRSSLHFAASRGDIEIFDYIISLGADPTLVDAEKNTPFFICAQHGHLALLKHIVETLKQDPLQKRDDSTSGIHLASSNGDIKSIEYLLEKGASVEDPSNFGYPINWAAGYNQFETVKFLLSKGASANGDIKGVIPAPLILSVDYCKKDLFDLLISHGADVNVTDSSGWSVLHLCAEKGNIDFMKILLEKGADPNYHNQKKTPLQLAFEHSQIDLFQILKHHTSQEIDQSLADEYKDKLKQQKEEEEFTPVTLDSNKATALKEQGNELFRSKQYEEALLKYSEATKFDSNMVSLHTNIAACLIFLKRFEEALKHTRRAKKVDPEWIKTYFREGEIYNALQIYAEAAPAFWECFKREPTSKLYKDLFNIALAKGKVQYAIQNKKQ